MEGIIIWVLIVIGIAVFNGLFSKSDEETAYEQRKEIFDKIRLRLDVKDAIPPKDRGLQNTKHIAVKVKGLFGHPSDNKTKVIISIFAGRAGDVGKDPVPEFKKSINMAKRFKNVEILWASVREPYNFIQAKQLGCHIITVPPVIIEKIEKFGKTYKNLTIETVKAFLDDSKKSRFRID